MSCMFIKILWTPNLVCIFLVIAYSWFLKTYLQEEYLQNDRRRTYLRWVYELFPDLLWNFVCPKRIWDWKWQGVESPSAQLWGYLNCQNPNRPPASTNRRSQCATGILKVEILEALRRSSRLTHPCTPLSRLASEMSNRFGRHINWTRGVSAATLVSFKRAMSES